MLPLVMIVAGFIAGSIPWGVIVAKQRGVDIRAKGSGNIGATNVGRVLGVRDGLLVLFLDSAKGWLITLAAARFDGDPWVVAATGFAAILGHCFSPLLGGKGGKGVATALGVFVIVSPALALVAVAVFLVVAGRTRIAALGSLGGVTSATIYAFVTSAPTSVEMLALATSLLLVYTHRNNLAQLLYQLD
ncbi:MAG TPA: glycerol-3-phosphate acyltransferase [Kofleriaceae bacterium]